MISPKAPKATDRKRPSLVSGMRYLHNGGMKHTNRTFLLPAVIALVLAACGGPEPTHTSSPTGTTPLPPAPTAAPSPTPTPTATPTDTPAAISPSPTPTVINSNVSDNTAGSYGSAGSYGGAIYNPPSPTPTVTPSQHSATSTQAPRWEEVATWGNGADGLSFNAPNGIAIDAADHVYTTEFQGHRVRMFTPEGELLAEWGGLGSELGQLRSPTGIVVGPDGRIYVTESGGHRVQVFSSEGTFLDTWGEFGDGPGEFASAMTVALDDDMRIYVRDWGTAGFRSSTALGGFCIRSERPAQAWGR